MAKQMRDDYIVQIQLPGAMGRGPGRQIALMSSAMRLGGVVNRSGPRSGMSRYAASAFSRGFTRCVCSMMSSCGANTVNGAFRLLSFFSIGIAARGAKRGAGIGGEHVLDEAAMHVGKIVRRLAKGEPAAPGAEHMAALGRRPQRLLAVFFHLPLLLLRR